MERNMGAEFFLNQVVPSNKEHYSILPEQRGDRYAEQVMKDADYTILHEMFDWQRRFGDTCFNKNKIVDNEGNILSFGKIYQEYLEGKFGPNDLPNEWLRKFHECMQDELDEVKEMLPWKHWSKATIGEEKYKDLPAQERVNMLKIELIDIWHFLMSAMMCVGIGPQELHDMYIAKNKVNFERQQKGYNTAHKTEEDNLKLAKEEPKSFSQVLHENHELYQKAIKGEVK